jgi:hypothetical protein
MLKQVPYEYTLRSLIVTSVFSVKTEVKSHTAITERVTENQIELALSRSAIHFTEFPSAFDTELRLETVLNIMKIISNYSTGYKSPQTLLQRSRIPLPINYIISFLFPRSILFDHPEYGTKQTEWMHVVGVIEMVTALLTEFISLTSGSSRNCA